MFKVAYLGFSLTMLEYLNIEPDVDLKIAFCDQDRITPQYFALCKRIDCLSFSVFNSSSIEEILKKIGVSIDFFVIYKTSIIVKEELLKKYCFYNFHPGDLSINRGAHPLVWNILMDEKQAVLSLHQIDSKIDQGILIGTYEINIFTDDTPTLLEQKLVKGIPPLIKKMLLFHQGEIKGMQVYGGGYRRKVKSEDYTIDLLQDSQRKIICKINSQKSYLGAVLFYQGKFFRVTNYCLSLLDPLPANWIFIEDKNIFLELSNMKNI